LAKYIFIVKIFLNLKKKWKNLKKRITFQRNLIKFYGKIFQIFNFSFPKWYMKNINLRKIIIQRKENIYIKFQNKFFKIWLRKFDLKYITKSFNNFRIEWILIKSLFYSFINYYYFDNNQFQSQKNHSNI
jgi:hypothetical protein